MTEIERVNRGVTGSSLGFRATDTDLVRVRAEEEEVEGDGRDQVDDEPAPEVVDRDLGRLTHNLVVLADVGRPEVDQDVDDEHDVD